jgi:ABC-type bacteriocin/lantibiotic exporter with double-glycine peptidase domain
MATMIEQLTERIEGNHRAVGRAGEIFMSMIDRKLMKQLKNNSQQLPDSRQLERMLMSKGIFFREVTLSGKWWSRTTGNLLAFTTEDDTPVVLKPGFSSYSFVHPQTGKVIVLSNKTKGMLKPQAYATTQPLPAKRLTLWELVKFAWQGLSGTDLSYICLACISVVLLTMFTPYVTKQIFSEVVPSGSADELLPVAVLLFSATVGLVMLQVTRSLVVFRVKDKLEYALQTALMTRLLHLPNAFFRNWTAGDLSSRVLSLSRFSGLLTESMLTTMLSALFSAILFIQFFIYGGPLLFVGIGVLALQLFFTLLNFYYVRKVQSIVTPHRSRMFGLLYELFGGIQKIRTNGAEERAFSLWAESFVYTEPNSAYQPAMYTYSGSLAFVVKMLPMMITIAAAWYYNLPLSDYIAYCAVLGIALDTIGQLETIMKQLGRVLPEAKLCQPILDAEPEDIQNQQVVTKVEGAISISGLRFRFSETAPWIFDGFNLDVKPGEYIGITGPSGSGKSTLLRLLLGFETPTEGYIRYDHYNLKEVNKSVLRSHCVGSVLQNGRLIEGTLLDNIRFTAPKATDDEVWEAIRLVALDEDISHMPHGLMTPISEDGHGISGGQRQRILLARALVQHPAILLLDEATSALDNVTQQRVAKHLANMKCTRIMISQRPENLRYCHRIITIQ